MAIAHLPPIEARAGAERGAVHIDRCFSKCAAGPRLAASAPPAGRLSRDVICKLARLAGRPPRVRAEPELDSPRHRRPQLDASAKPMRGHACPPARACPSLPE